MMMVLPIANAKLPTTGRGSFLFERSADHLHRGVDIAAAKGTPVVAAAAGIVRHAYTKWQKGFTGYGRVVVVHSVGSDGLFQLYAHLDSVRVPIGKQVQEGEILGTVGTSAFTAEGNHVDENLGAHLHFEVSPFPYPQASEAERLDPVAWLAGKVAQAVARIPLARAPAVAPASLHLHCPHCSGLLRVTVVRVDEVS